MKSSLTLLLPVARPTSLSYYRRRQPQENKKKPESDTHIDGLISRLLRELSESEQVIDLHDSGLGAFSLLPLSCFGLSTTQLFSKGPCRRRWVNVHTSCALSIFVYAALVSSKNISCTAGFSSSSLSVCIQLRIRSCESSSMGTDTNLDCPTRMMEVMISIA